MSLEDAIQLLPKYLSKSAREDLFSELKNFPDNIDHRIYSTHIPYDKIYQGDGIEKLHYIDLPDERIGRLNGIVISNTCDMDLDNQRTAKEPIRLIHAPIFRIEHLKRRLLERFPNTDQLESKINTYVDNIKKQRISNIFYLPSGQNALKEDSFIFFDRIISVDRESISLNNEGKYQKIFSLSNLGFYLFVYKLSIHFCRIREGTDRNLSFNLQDSNH